uniref:Uncharacterized protein n=1 Tax=Arundo donax TaxID=35708 RepID=A0A0A8ZPE2_ARUDO
MIWCHSARTWETYQGAHKCTLLEHQLLLMHCKI